MRRDEVAKQKEVVSAIQERLINDCWPKSGTSTVRNSGEIKDLAIALGVAIDKLHLLRTG